MGECARTAKEKNLRSIWSKDAKGEVLPRRILKSVAELSLRASSLRVNCIRLFAVGCKSVRHSRCCARGFGAQRLVCEEADWGIGAMINKFLRWAATVLIGLQLAGCYTDLGPVASDSTPIPLSAIGSRIQPGDQLKVIVFGEEGLSGLYDVSPGGTISMPLVGSIMAAGRTKLELEHALTHAYASGKYLEEPKITVAIVSYRPFYVLGEVTTPGQFPYRTSLEVLDAIATAGGFTYRASKTSVLIRHAGQGVWQEYSLATPVPVAPGDIIRVPERYF